VRRVTQHSRLRYRLLALWLGIFAAAAIPVQAQLLYGGLVGSVIDAQGSIVPGARVTIVNTDTNLTRDTTTDAQGQYSFTNIQAGPYDDKDSKKRSARACPSRSARSAASI
jgi:hypothetical protein